MDGSRGCVNDRLFEIVQGHPDRFVGLGTLPMQDVDLALAELERVVRELRFAGLEICTNVNGVDFDDARFVPFFEKVVEHDLLLVVHPHGFFDGRRLADHYLINTVGMPMDSTVFIARMIFGGVLERFPDLKVCVTHGGGYLPFSPARFDHAYEARDDCREHIDRPPSTYLAQMYFDTMVFDPGMLGTLVDRWGADHVLLGTDYPFDMGETDPLGLLDRVVGLADADRAMIAGGNAARLLRSRSVLRRRRAVTSRAGADAGDIEDGTADHGPGRERLEHLVHLLRAAGPSPRSSTRPRARRARRPSRGHLGARSGTRRSPPRRARVASSGR